MDSKKYKTTSEMKKFAQENPNLVEKSYKDLQIFLKTFMVFIVIGIAVSTYFLAQAMMM